MRDREPIYTTFGGWFLEDRDDPLPPPKPKNRWLGPVLLLLIVVLLAATIPALAFTVRQHHRTSEAVPRQQPSYFLRAPPTVGFDTRVF